MRVLFVDDEVKVLEGLERSLLMVADDEWELEFVEGGAAAVACLREREFDAVVTDMRMPGIDGAEVLRQAQALAPGTARIVLSGQMEDGGALEAVTRAHQVLSKPSNSEALCGVLRSATRYRGLLENDAFRRAVLTVDRLPAAPAVYREIEAELRSDDASVARLAAIAAKDTGLTARLMHVANSPFFGGGRKLVTAAQAIGRLGLQLLSGLAAAAVFDGRDFPAKQFDVTAVQQHALRTAELAVKLLPKDAGAAYLAGMLTEVGHLVIATSLPAQYDAAAIESRTSGVALQAVERATWGASHADVGAYLLALWGMPAAVVDAVGYHHGQPADSEAPVDPCLAAAVAAAAALAEGRAPIDDDLAVLGLSLERALATAEQA